MKKRALMALPNLTATDEMILAGLSKSMPSTVSVKAGLKHFYLF